MNSMLPGVKVQDIRKNIDERGFFAEILREDWTELLGEDKIVQANLSYSFPGMIRAWHRHNRGQVDYLSGEKLQVVRIPGQYWHGTKTLGDGPSLTVYCVNRLYDLKNPDEERRAWNDSTIIDSKSGKAYDWNKPPHK